MTAPNHHAPGERCRCAQHYCVICGADLDDTTWISHMCEPTGPRLGDVRQTARPVAAPRPRRPQAVLYRHEVKRRSLIARAWDLVRSW